MGKQASHQTTGNGTLCSSRCLCELSPAAGTRHCAPRPRARRGVEHGQITEVARKCVRWHVHVNLVHGPQHPVPDLVPERHKRGWDARGGERAQRGRKRTWFGGPRAGDGLLLRVRPGVREVQVEVEREGLGGEAYICHWAAAAAAAADMLVAGEDEVSPSTELLGEKALLLTEPDVRRPHRPRSKVNIHSQFYFTSSCPCLLRRAKGAGSHTQTVTQVPLRERHN